MMMPCSLVGDSCYRALCPMPDRKYKGILSVRYDDRPQSKGVDYVLRGRLRVVQDFVDV